MKLMSKPHQLRKINKKSIKTTKKKIAVNNDVKIKKEPELDSFHEKSESEENSDSDNESFCEQFSDEEPKAKRRLSHAHNSDEEISKKKFKRENDLYKPPTVEELNQLRETENLFHSNLFRLQTEEILAEVKLADKYKKRFDVWYEKFKQNIESLKETKKKKVCDLTSFKKFKTKIPVLDVPENEKEFFQFLKPSKISIIGSYALDTTIGPNVIIDIMVEMPSKIFRGYDHQNYRYFKKRAIYLTYIAMHLTDEIAEKKMFFGESWMPKLKLIPSGPLSKKVTIHVHVAANSSSFELNQFSPEKNNVQPNWYFKTDSSDLSELIPTPFYNSNILHDLTMAEANSHCAKMLSGYPNIRDGIILIKIWLRQRQSESAYDAFNGHILTMYVLYLLMEKKLNTFMSCYQIIRNVWNNLAQTNWCEQGISMNKQAENIAKLEEYKNFYDYVFLDMTGNHNLVANIPVSNYLWLRSEANLAVKSLDNPSVDSFQVLFMRRLPFYSLFDHVICLHDTQELEKLANEQISHTRKLDMGLNKRMHLIKMIYDLLREGLGRRISQIYVRPDTCKEWALNKKSPNSWRPIFIGLQLNPERCFEIIDKGPVANLPEADAFRKFWGQKSELRRFQDGSICEAVVWSKENTLAEKRIICKKIIMYLLKGKLDISKHQYLYGADQAEEFLRFKKTSITKFKYGTGEEATFQVIKVFNELEKELLSLSDLPLAITGIQASSAVFRYTDVFPPLATVYKPDDKNTMKGENCLLLNDESIEEAPKYAPISEAIIQLSASGKWPDDLEAVRKTKAAFHLQIAENLRKVYNYQIRVNMNYLDIFKEGFIFRIKVAHQKEIALMKQKIGANGIILYRDNDESIELEKQLFHLPKLNGALYGLHSQQPSFGPTCCLAKRWLSAHLIDSSHIPDIVIELIVASIYLTPEPYKSAQMPQVAFFRFLEFFASDVWRTEPIIVNFNDEMSREQIITAENLYRSNKETLPLLFIITPYDQSKSIWTKKTPSMLILNRINSLARESLKLIEKELFDNFTLILKPIFKSPLSEYDILIHLKTEFNPKIYQYYDLDETFPKNSWHPYKFHTEQKLPVIDFDPIQMYLNELRCGYSEFALFFHDTYGGSVVGVLFNPKAVEPKDFKVANMNCRKINAKGKLVINIEALVEDFNVIGRNLIDHIHVNPRITL
ncbi:nucleolar protein 6 [Chelonus insularis]|uniref:nucleolar protein 6 n=1 Tax=Chelonus insularis TaxID=460826 RepID=UPI00158B65BB|nr:nucleolar protein 6 [Chelonus insularis]